MDTNVVRIYKAYSLEKLSFFICIQTNLHTEHDGAFWIRICLKDFYAVRAYFLNFCRILHALESSPYMQMWFVIQLHWDWPVVYLSCVHFWKPVLWGLYFVMYTFLKLGVIRLSQQCNWCLCSWILCLVSGQWMCKVLNLHYGPIFRSQISNETSWNIRHQLPSSAVQYSRRTEISFFKFLGGSFDTPLKQVVIQSFVKSCGCLRCNGCCLI